MPHRMRRLALGAAVQGLLAVVLVIPITAVADNTPLIVCADPNNLPFSNRSGDGFENKLARLLADGLHRPLQYVWWAQRRGFARHTLGEGQCDLWPGVATGVEGMATTQSYYRSSYVFVTRRRDPLDHLTLNDPRLASLRIGVQMVGDDAMNTPPAHALAMHHLTQNVHGYMLYGNYVDPNPPAAVVAAVARGNVDVSIVWGPLAGYWASRSGVPLRIESVTPSQDTDSLPMRYAISVGVRRDEPQLRDQLDVLISANRSTIDRILRHYHVPVE